MKPIIMSTEDVRAVLDGRKTMFRLVAKELDGVDILNCRHVDGDIQEPKGYPIGHVSLTERCKFKTGDVLYVRETWQEFYQEEVTEKHQQGPRGFAGSPADEAQGHYMHFYYRADGEVPDHPTMGKALWKPSIFMPKEACRLFLRVTDVRVERVQDMPLFDVWDEGTPQLTGYRDAESSVNHNDFRILWDSLNAKRGYGWGTNPWVWVYSFERVDKPAGWPGVEGGE